MKIIELSKRHPQKGFAHKIKSSSPQLCRYEYFVFALLGAIVFLAVYGFTPLIVNYDKWILNGYVENDIIQHYAGWMAYRKSAWSFPLGSFGTVFSGIISYTDSIPWIAIIFKILSPVLPETFQFFGIYVLGCYMLQGIASGMILRLFFENKIATLFGSFIMCLSPIMMERAFRHTALASHWLILFSLFLFFQSKYTGKVSLKYAVLGVLAIGIHPYFLPMIFGIMVANILYVSKNGKKVCLVSSGKLLLSLLFTVIFGYIIGIFKTGSISSSGFGFYSMNLNAIFNPISCGNIIWSLIIPPQTQVLGQYDGFNYLGLGILICLPVLLYFVATNFKKILKEYWGLAAVCVIFFLFAVSNWIILNDVIIITYPLPKIIFDLASIFRASSRMFYPIFYLITIGCICSIERLNKIKALIIIIAIIQLIDVSPAIETKHSSFAMDAVETNYNNHTYFSSETLKEISEHSTEIKSLNNIRSYGLAAWELKQGYEVNASFGCDRYQDDRVSKLYYDTLNEASSGNNHDVTYLYATDNKSEVDSLLKRLPDNKEIVAFYNHFYFIVEKEWNITGERVSGTVTADNDIS